MQYSSRCKVEKIFYYEIAVGSLGLKQQSIFTYTSNQKLTIGQVVEVELKHNLCTGVVIRTTAKPKFTIKQLVKSYGLTIPKSLLTLMLWAIDFYPGESGAMVKLFLPPNLIKESSSDEDKITTLIEIKDSPLTSDQKKALKIIQQEIGTYLLHGSTGSGKTRVYVELAKNVIKTGKSVIILSPEIGLSEQLQSNLAKSFSNYFSYHSLQTPKQRRETWLAIEKSSGPNLIVGPRSALFLPLKNIGLIIIDEAHDAAYKQLQSPHYATLQIATKLAQISKARLIYGSATPNVADYYAALNKNFPVIEMKERPVASQTKHSVDIQIIDSKDRQQFKRNAFISDEAIARIRDSVQRGMQCLILLNRRGTAQLLQCETCLWQYRCPSCDHTLVYHRDKHRAICHYCGKDCPMATICPEDEGSVKQMNIGTKYIEETCKSLFPTENIERIDRDSIERETVKETMLSLAKGNAKILVGTQLLAKGLDLPLLNTIVVLDASSKSSDFLGDERYYQLLHQVIGRGMRGHQNTKIFIQTPDAQDQIVKWATTDSWQDFYNHELMERKRYHYPPFVQLATIRFARKNASSAEKIFKSIQDKVNESGVDIEMLGPLPTRSAKKGMTNWVILLKANKRVNLQVVAKFAPSDSVIDYDPINTQ